MSALMPLRTQTGTDDCESRVYSFRLTLLSDEGILSELWLPKEPEGFFLFPGDASLGFVSICAKDGRWVAVCRKNAFFVDVTWAESLETVLTDGALLSVRCEERTYRVLVEKVTRRRTRFSNHDILSDLEISVGSRPDCGIFYSGPFLSGIHAILLRQHGRWTLRVHDTVHGVCVNGARQTDCSLQVGDVLFLMGLRILVGRSFLSVCGGLGSVTVAPDICQQNTLRMSRSYYDGTDAPSAETLFDRAPRKRRKSELPVITLEGPPQSLANEQLPAVLRFGRSAIMGGASALAGNFMSMITSVLFPFMTSRYTEAQRREYEQLRLQKYTEYLEQKRQEILAAIATEQRELNARYPHISQIGQIGRSERLWERRSRDSDLLQLRLGTGSRPLSATIEYPERQFTLKPDALEEQMYRLAEASYTVANVPIVLSLTEAFVTGIRGPREQRLQLLRSLILQTAVLHSYDEVKLVFLMRPRDLDRFGALRYLPHVWDDARTTRFIATDEAQAYSVGEYLQLQTDGEEELERDLGKLLKKRPYYVIFALDRKLMDGHEVFKKILAEDSCPGISVVTAYDNLPKECHKIITLRGEQGNTCTTMGTDGGADEIFSAEIPAQDQFDATMSRLANISLKQTDRETSLPKMLTFLEMFGVGRIEHLNPLKRWQENDPVKSLAVPVGVGEDGSPFLLDLHEKRQGPHGLVAGMTGSGKSEFLISYILSLAVNFHPDEVAFVLIDYKGGGLADAFANPRTGVRLPHLAGTITNLDGASIQRSLMSIESELVRRQKEFSRVSKAFDEGSMNIYTYQKLYRAGKVSEPMPHLFIISDEFAELKQQQPEFMEKLISAARIGRSLGVHLILATQKPSGVVNDQIRSNTKFRVCLRVQDRSDSSDMLQRPDAAELTDTGRFYLQVGYNEYFAMGQSAWCGADYEPQDTVQIKRDDSIEVVDITGQVIAQHKPKVRKSATGTKQIGAVVKYLSDLAAAQGISTKQLCRPALPGKLSLEEIDVPEDADPLTLCLGLLDDPENQDQFPFTLDIAQCQNLLLVGSSGCGKTSLIQTMLYTLCQRLPPEQFNFYILDYSSRMLKQFRSLPHCGSVLQEEDEGSLDEFFKLISGLVAERKQLFSELEVDNFMSARAYRELPLVLVVIDNIAGMANSKKGEDYLFRLQGYLKNCSNYGIQFVIAANHLGDISSRNRQELTTRIAFQMKDKYDYSDALNCKVTYLPPGDPGRGLFNWDGRPLEFQTAGLFLDLPEKARREKLKASIDALAARYGSSADARQLPVYSETATYEEFCRQFKPRQLPLGYSRQTGKPVALPLKQFSLLGIYFGDPAGEVPIIGNLLHAARRESMDLWILKRQDSSVFDRPDGIRPGSLPGADILPFSKENIDLLQQALIGVMSQRRAFLDSYYAAEHLDAAEESSFHKAFPALYEAHKPVLLFIESVADVCAALTPFRTMGLRDLFRTAARRNIYIVGGFGQDIPASATNNSLFALFSQKELLLFGGAMDKQSLCAVPEALKAAKDVAFNVGIMQYRGQLRSLMMPCGEIATAPPDEELVDIFTGRP